MVSFADGGLFNTLLFLLWGAVDLLFLLLVFRFFGLTGLVGLISASTVLMNLFVTKSVTILGLGATGGNVLYAGIFLATDLISEYYGGKEARQAVAVGFLASILALASSQITLLFVPAPWDWADAPLRVLFTPVVRIVMGSMLAYLVAQNLDIYLYGFIRKRWKPLWLRNNGSTWVSQAVDTVVFCTVALLGTMPTSAWLQILLSTYVLKILVAGLDTPFIYLSRRWKPADIKPSPQ